MMMLKMMNPMGSMPSVPKVGGEEEGPKLSREGAIQYMIYIIYMIYDIGRSSRSRRR